MTKKAEIARFGGIGSEGLQIHLNDQKLGGSRSVSFSRKKRINSQRTEDRSLGISSRPADTVAYDLISGLELIFNDDDPELGWITRYRATNRTFGRPSMRDRLAALLEVIDSSQVPENR